MGEGQDEDDGEQKSTISTNDDDMNLTSFSSSYNTVNSVGTYFYLAPELVNGLESMNDHAFYGAPVDVYSYGCIVYECLELRSPWSHDKKYTFAHKVLNAVSRGERPSLIRCDKKKLENVEAQMIDLMNECWNHDPHRRPVFSDIKDCVEGVRKENSFMFGSAKMPRRRKTSGKKPQHVLTHMHHTKVTHDERGEFEKLHDPISGSSSCSFHDDGNGGSRDLEMVKIQVS